MTIPTISTLPTAPARTDAPATFISRADAFLAALVVMQGELNTTITAMNASAADIDADVLLAQDWATKNDAAVTGTDWSAFANASGNAPTGSAKDWASEDEDTPVIAGEFSAKHYSIKSAASAAASSTSESNAATSETNAANSASAAATSESNAAATYDAFDDRYLGAFGTDPTTDNDGNPLQTGAQYFNTTNDVTRVYNGSSWQDSAALATSITVSQISDLTADATELNYTDGVTSAIQTQLDSKATYPSQTGNAGSFLTTDGTNPSWAEVSASPTLEATASGSLANGDMVIVNADGTVSVVTETLGPSVVGGQVVYNSATSRWNNVAYDSNSNKIVVAYRNDGNSNYGTAVVGTVSGTSITFGSPVVFNSGGTLVGDIVFDSNSNKIVILYRNDANNFYGTGIVGTVSGDSISFGSPSLFLNAQAEEISGVFDTSANKIAVFYRYVSNGNKGYASVGEVSGTSITFTTLGSAVQFNNDQTLYNSCVFDSNSNKCVVFYRGFPSDQGKARVGTISGLSISFGTEATFNAARSDRMSSAFDSNSNKCVVSYSEFGDSKKGKCVVGTVSGTSISFGSPVVFETDNSDFTQAMTFNSIRNKIVLAWMGESGGTYTSKVAAGTVSGTSISFDTPLTFLAGYSQNPTIIYDSGNDSSVLAYLDNTNSGYGTAQVFKSVTTSTTLTSENFIGVSDAAYSDGATAKIQLVGSVDDAQSGLTAGQTYYVQGDNTLSETPADPSVVAGTAVSATKLIVKG